MRHHIVFVMLATNSVGPLTPPKFLVGMKRVNAKSVERYLATPLDLVDKAQEHYFLRASNGIAIETELTQVFDSEERGVEYANQLIATHEGQCLNDENSQILASSPGNAPRSRSSQQDDEKTTQRKLDYVTQLEEGARRTHQNTSEDLHWKIDALRRRIAKNEEDLVRKLKNLETMRQQILAKAAQ